MSPPQKILISSYFGVIDDYNPDSIFLLSQFLL